jgi:DNA-binding transcriptional LysR family regulator
MDDGSFVALPLAPANRRVLLASPGYVKRHGQPENLEALADHDCLVYFLSGSVHDKWAFHEKGKRRVLKVRGSLQTDDGDIVRRLALDGEGIVYKSWLDVSEDVRAKRLVVLLKQFEGESAPLHLVCPHRKQFSPAVQQLHQLLRQRCDALAAAMPKVRPMFAQG